MAQLCDAEANEKRYNEETGEWEVVRDDLGRPIKRPCKAYAMKGFTKCVTHVRGYQRTVARLGRSWAMGELLAELDIPDLNPMDGLLEAVRYSGAMMRVLAHLVAQLGEAPDLLAGFDGQIMQMSPGLWGIDRFGEQAPHVLMKMYDQWMDRYTRSCKMAIEAGLDERMVRNAEFTSQVMVQAFSRALTMVPSLTQDQRTELGLAMAQSVRQLRPGEDDEARRVVR